MIESRVKMFHKLTKLHGKLYLLMTQVSMVMHRNKHSSLHVEKLVVSRQSLVNRHSRF